MKEKKEELADFDTIFDQMVSQLEFEMSNHNNYYNRNDSKPKRMNKTTQEQKQSTKEISSDLKEDTTVTTTKKSANDNVIDINKQIKQTKSKIGSNSNTPTRSKETETNSNKKPKQIGLAQTRRTFDRLLNQMNGLMNESTNYCIRFADRNGVELLCRYLQKSLEILQRNLSKLEKYKNKNYKNSDSKSQKEEKENIDEEEFRLETIKTRVEIEMEMRTFAYLFGILNQCVSNEINLPFLKGHRTQNGYQRIEENTNESKESNKTVSNMTNEDTTDANEAKEETQAKKVKKALKEYKKEQKMEKRKKRGNAIVQYNSKQMTLIVGSMIFYIVRDFSKYSLDLQRESMKFVSVATNINGIRKWLIQMHSKLIVCSIIKVLSINSNKKEQSGPGGATLTKRRGRGMQLKASKNKNNSNNKQCSNDEFERGFDLVRFRSLWFVCFWFVFFCMHTFLFCGFVFVLS